MKLAFWYSNDVSELRDVRELNDVSELKLHTVKHVDQRGRL